MIAANENQTWAIRRILASLLITATLIIQGEAAQGKTVTGWIEDAYIYPEVFVVRAKIDTGAENSSLHASRITFYKYQGKRWLRFQLVNRYGEKMLITKPEIRTVRIKRHRGEMQERPVIRLEICLSGIKKNVDVNVVDRSSFDYQLLIGSFLQNDFLVDPTTTDKSNARCKKTMTCSDYGKKGRDIEIH